MASKSDTAVVLGADIEGLTAAATLAAAGRTVHLVDARAEVGGLSAPREIHPGHVVPGLLHETANLRRSALAPLELERRGLSFRTEVAPLFVVGENDSALAIPFSGDFTSLGADAEAYGRWRRWLRKLTGVVSDLLDDPPPKPDDPGPGDLLRLAKKALKLRALGERDMLELLRVAPLPAWDWTEELFENPMLRAGLIAPVLTGTRVGPRAAGTGALLLLRESTRDLEPEGGFAAVVAALRARCEELGVETHLGGAPTAIRTEGGRVCAVELAGGAAIDAAIVVSALDPGRALVDLVAPGVVPLSVEQELAHWRAEGTTAVALLALSSTPEVSGCYRGAERFVTARAPLELERAADALKYGELPEAPWLDVRVWSASDPACAPAHDGQRGATLSVHIHGVPYEPSGGWTDEARARLRERVLAALDRAAPGARDALLAEEWLTPRDLEERFGVSRGHLYGGELALDQLWVQRPSLALSRYATPVQGLFLGGSGSHPGGIFAGRAGSAAAHAALRD